MEIEGATASSTGTCSLQATPKEQIIRKRNHNKVLKASEKPKQEPPGLTGWLIGKPEPKVEQHYKSFESFDTDRVTDRMSCEENKITDEKLEDKLDDVAMLLEPCVEMRSVRNVENTAPSVFNWVKDADQSKVACAFKRGGYCTTHKVKAKKILVTSTKVKDRGRGRG